MFLSSAEPARRSKIVALASLACIAATAARAQTIPSDAAALCPVAPATFATWFASGIPTQNGIVNPANSVTFNTSSNCNFYAWSEQMFLWVNSPTPPQYTGTGRVFESGTFYQVVPVGNSGALKFLSNVQANGKLKINLRSAQVDARGFQQIFDNKGIPHEIVPTPMRGGKPLLRDVSGALIAVEKIALDGKGRPAFFAAKNKAIRPQLKFSAQLTAAGGPSPVQKFQVGHTAVFLDANNNPIMPDQGQAGGGGVLIAQNGGLVYYTSFVNDVYAFYLTQIKDMNGGKTPAGTQFPTTQAQANSIVAYAAAHGTKIPDPEALAIELKASWVEVTQAEAANYVTIQADVPVYNPRTASQWTLTTQTRPATLGLVGMHVVGSVAGHPEMLWSTFERFGNTPNAAYSYINSANQTVAVPQNTSGSWRFCATNCSGPFNTELALVNSTAPGIGNIIQPAPAPGAPPPPPIGPSNTIRWHAWGAGANTPPNAGVTSAAQSNSQVISMNNSVMSQLVGNDLRKNYIFTGSAWADDGVEPNNPFYGALTPPPPVPPPPPPSTPGNEVGTSQISNSSMETYQQGTTNNGYGQYGNCFQCHNQTTPPRSAKPAVQISHIWDSLIALSVPGNANPGAKLKKK